MSRVLEICVKGRLILEMHEATKCVALSSRRNICSQMGLKKSRNHPLKSADFFLGSILLSFRCPWLPLKCEHVKDSGLALGSCHVWQREREKATASGGATISQHCTAC